MDESNSGIVIDKVTIPLSRYKQLLDAEQLLTALQNGGVDNWSGYSYAIELYEKEVKEDVEKIA